MKRNKLRWNKGDSLPGSGWVHQGQLPCQQEQLSVYGRMAPSGIPKAPDPGLSPRIRPSAGGRQASVSGQRPGSRGQPHGRSVLPAAVLSLNSPIHSCKMAPSVTSVSRVRGSQHKTHLRGHITSAGIHTSQGKLEEKCD